MKQKKKSAKNKKGIIPGLLSFLGLAKKTKSSVNSETAEEARPKGFELEIADLKKKISNFMKTRQVSSGVVSKLENYTLSKTADKLFRLEGKTAAGQEYSIIVSTGNYLDEKQGKIVGLIEMPEVALNRAIGKNHKSLESFFGEYLSGLDSESLSRITGNPEKFNWKEILDWPRFWQDQLLLKLGANTIAVLLVKLDEDFKNFFLNKATKKQKSIVNDELFFINQGVTNPELSPHSRSKSLYDVDLAFREFNEMIEKLKTAITLDKSLSEGRKSVIRKNNI